MVEHEKSKKEAIKVLPKKIKIGQSRMANNTADPSNHSSPSPKLPCRVIFNAKSHPYLGISYYLPLIIALILTALITVACNSAFLFVVFRSPRLRTVHNTLLISLAVTDFLTGLAVTPIYAATLIFVMNEHYPCVLFWFRLISFDAVAIVTFGILALISFEKYLAVIHPYYYQRVIRKRKLILITFVVWTFGTTFSLLSHIISLSHPKIHKLLWLYAPYLGVIFYIAILYCYGRIFQEVRKVERRIAIENTVQTHESARAIRKGSKVAKTTAVVIGALTLCYLPYLIIHILTKETKKLVPIPRKLKIFLKLSSYAVILFNSALNPVICYMRMSSVRREFRRIFCLRTDSA